MLVFKGVQTHITISAVKRLVTINRIENKGFVYIKYLSIMCIFIMYL